MGVDSTLSIIFHINLPIDGHTLHIPIIDLEDLLKSISKSTLPPKEVNAIYNKDLVGKFKNELSGNNCEFLILDISDNRFNPSKLELLFGFLKVALDEVKKTEITKLPKGICVFVEKHDKITLKFQSVLEKFCKENNIAFVVTEDNTGKSKILSFGDMPADINLPVIKRAAGTSAEPSLEEITKNEIQLLFGHFEIGNVGKLYHIPVITSLKKLLENTQFISGLKKLLKEKFKNDTFKVLPLGIPFSKDDPTQDKDEIEKLAIFLVDDDKRLLSTYRRNDDIKGQAILLLCDLLSPHYDIPGIIKEIKKSGAATIILLGLAELKNFKSIKDVETISFLKLDFDALSETAECKFCIQGVPILKGKTFEDLSRQLLAFDSFTFWEFLKLGPKDKGFYKIGHEKMKSTGYHYNFRILCEPIFRQYEYNVATRIANLLNMNGIFFDWINNIVCPIDENSPVQVARLLAEIIADFIGLKKESIISIPRSCFDTVGAKDMGSKAKDYFHSNPEFGINPENRLKILKNKRVIIVDQAAHHFNTLGPLKNICLSFENCKVLATCLFVNRTNASNLESFLGAKKRDKQNQHFISLFSWPNQPEKIEECFCFNTP